VVKGRGRMTAGRRKPPGRRSVEVNLVLKGAIDHALELLAAGKTVAEAIQIANKHAKEGLREVHQGEDVRRVVLGVLAVIQVVVRLLSLFIPRAPSGL